MQQKRILMAGCGSLGSAIGLALCAEGHQVWGLRRRAEAVPSPVRPIGADLSQPVSLRNRLPEALDAVIYCLTPAQMDEAGYRMAYVEGLQNLLAEGARAGWSPQQLIYVSSSSVYAQDDDSWVDENSATQPEKATSRQLLNGEQLALSAGIPATVIRFSGIYGGQRTRFIEQVRAGRASLRQDSPWTNRIHEDDCIGVISHLLQLAFTGRQPDPVYLASDCRPARLGEVALWLHQRLGLPAPHQDQHTGEAANRRAGSKRCNNQRLLESGYIFRYPSYREGYDAMLKTAESLAKSRLSATP